MIALLTKAEHPGWVELFELFKVPWAPYDPNKEWEVVISDGDAPSHNNWAALVLYNSQEVECDAHFGFSVDSDPRNSLTFDGQGVPVYCGLGQVSGGQGSAHVKLGVTQHDQLVFRVGYNVADELLQLLTEGQPAQHGRTPTLDIHIQLLRSIVLQTGAQFVEVLPRPWDHRFFVASTHDIDHLSLREHFVDRTLMGFFYRSLVEAPVDWIKGKKSLSGLIKAVFGVFRLPLSLFGPSRDPWFTVPKIAASERKLGIRGTYFFLPARHGTEVVAGRKIPYARYDLGKYTALLKTLVDQGMEVGLHGAFAWRGTAEASQELARVIALAGTTGVTGIRMHYLVRTERTFSHLDEVGFFYDSTMGYGNQAGYKSGTTQVYRPPGTEHLLELPLHLHDTALFSRTGLYLSGRQAINVASQIYDHAAAHGGVVTLLWHCISFAHPRSWEFEFVKLIELARAKGAAFATANQVVTWFAGRRQIRFHSDERHIRIEAPSAAWKYYVRTYASGAVVGEYPLGEEGLSILSRKEAANDRTSCLERNT